VRVTICGLGLLLLSVGCGSGGGGKSSRASAAPVTSGTPGPVSTATTPTPGGPAPLPANASLTRVGAPAGGLPVISDLEVFDGKLWLAESLNPLGQFGAQLWSWDPAAGFVKVIDDPTSQGFLRARAIGGKLYVPDADANGLAPGIVHVLDAATAPPRATVVDAHVHTFDVVAWNQGLFALGGLDTGESGVNRFDAALGRWTVVSRGPFSRLKYGGVLDGALLSTKRQVGTTDADLVQIDAAGAQTGLTLIPGEANVVCVEAARGGLYLTLSTSTGLAHVRLEPGGAVINLTGISGALLFDFVQHSDGNVYAVGMDGQTSSFVYGSQDGVAFTRLVTVNDLRFGQVPGNADGRPSIASFQGQLYCGSSTDGALYRID
jgi:hypothetical protein